MQNPISANKKVAKPKKVYLIFVKLAIFVRWLSLLLEGNDNETDEDVDHEESNDNDVNEIENGNNGSEIVYGAIIFSIGVNGHI